MLQSVASAFSISTAHQTNVPAAGAAADLPVPTAAVNTQRKKQKGAEPAAGVLPNGTGHVPGAAPAPQQLSKKQRRKQQQQQSKATAHAAPAEPASEKPAHAHKLSKKQQKEQQQQQQQVEAAADELLAELDAEVQAANARELLDIEAEHDSQSGSEDEEDSELEADSEQEDHSEQEGSDVAGAQQLLCRHANAGQQTAFWVTTA